MHVSTETLNQQVCAIVTSEKLIIHDTQSALDFILSVSHQTDCSRIALNKEAFSEDFFSLRTGLAGEILQKFSNYQIKFAIIGDFSGYTSKALHDFIYECNNGQQIFFVSTKEQAIQKLCA
ncbi:DUF4180 domain-containing protein [Listeria costaricensis]|uniref:DUF4180 domain-containing protein n=1 Tax=Listeria costaricensis TaxID=2026604 RepID=UPI000C07F075|nr:DUF4180 domain-containing protein [Listeria costaricensis]